jgi:hypothetical protein
MFEEKDIALKISANLEFLIKKNKVKAQQIADFIGTTKQLVSRNRQLLKSGKLPNSKFLVGISLFFDYKFF